MKNSLRRLSAGRMHYPSICLKGLRKSTKDLGQRLQAFGWTPLKPVVLRKEVNVPSTSWTFVCEFRNTMLHLYIGILNVHYFIHLTGYADCNHRKWEENCPRARILYPVTEGFNPGLFHEICVLWAKLSSQRTDLQNSHLRHSIQS